MAARISTAGHVLDHGGRRVSVEAFSVARGAVAYGGGRYLIAWQSWAEDHYEISGARLDRGGSRLGSGDIEIEAGRIGEYPAVASDGRDFFVVWNSRWPSTPSIFGERVSAQGRVLDAAPIEISDPFLSPGDHAAVAFDGTNYLVVWESGSGIVGRRLSRTGAVRDEHAFPISPYPRHGIFPAIAFDGSNFLVVWAEGRGDYPDIHGARVTPRGEVLDPGGFAIATAAQTQNAPAVAAGPGGYLVVWQDWQPDCCSVRGARVSSSGAVLDPNGIQIRGHSGGVERAPAVAFDSKNYVVVWSERSSQDVDIWGARVSRSGAVLDRAGVLLSTAAQAPTVRCRVPRVVGLRLDRASQRIRRSRCSVGRVRRAASRRGGIVLAQSPRAGAIRKHGYPVSLVVGRR